jgi:IS1 family transposase
VRVAGQWRYVYRAIDQFGQVIDVFVCRCRDANAARRFLERAIGTTKVIAVEVTTDQAPVYPTLMEELLPAAWHRTDCYANNRVEADHGRLKARLRPMRGLKQDHSARVVIVGHAFVQNVRRGYYELAAEKPPNRRVAVAFDELALAMGSRTEVAASTCPGSAQRNRARVRARPAWVVARQWQCRPARCRPNPPTLTGQQPAPAATPSRHRNHQYRHHTWADRHRRLLESCWAPRWKSGRRVEDLAPRSRLHR